MGDISVFLYLIILILILLPHFHLSLAASGYNCPVSICGSIEHSIRFPFRMLNQQPDVCGYPGFDLRCNEQAKIILNIPNSGEFAVRSIDYQSQVVQLYDPSISSCTASRLHTLDLSDSPFTSTQSQNFTLLSCPVEVTTSRYVTVGCLSNSTHSILATKFDSFAKALVNQKACEIVGSLLSPISKYQDEQGMTTNLNMDLFLTWDDPNCQDCSAIGGTCGYTNATTQEISCFGDYTPKGNKKVIMALIIVSMALAIPAIAASITMMYYIFRDYRSVATWVSRNATPNIMAVTPETAANTHDGIIIGLDQMTIESYTKVILGESKRLPGLEDAACSICLSEYDVKEIVKCIPECRHCFHADCIDEWLKMKGTCPVCRNTPSPAHVEL
ncbi:putative RING-H2 finger protein ATL21A [Rutidosis leptorrhynchoides]|uniref:putative RING-H2 finger protein ATL21A n=1 Tax=Rutidosis leptorrhynchoides TaxID=125765 RepID=UPI003A99C0AC